MDVDGLFGAATGDTPYHHGAWPGEVGPSCYELAQGDPDVVEGFEASVLRGVTVEDQEQP
ncbi:MAG: hypothetical protein KY460_13160 [Actinobacteria bacterium]|nr:hypothetical protein [Actinomycetota bacterium]